ncbi:MAG: STELLO glycosyltransferase family protein, partial [Desulfobacterales bacterium]
YRCIPDGAPWANVYAYFTDQRIWPRGFPLDRIHDPGAVMAEDQLKLETVRVGVWQGLADGDPDVDAIYRLTVGTACRFKPAEPVVLPPGTHSPFNSQNTLFRKALFPLLYLPALVTFRFTDILRGWVAQPIMWRAGFQLGFTRATVFQERNPHDDLQDFESEIPGYLNAQRVMEIAQEAVGSDVSVSDNLARVYGALARVEIVSDDELRLLDAWLVDCQKLGCGS